MHAIVDHWKVENRQIRIKYEKDGEINEIEGELTTESF